MRIPIVSWRSIGLVGLICVPCAQAHHSAVGLYDVNRAAEIQGEVVRVRWVNPHVAIDLQAGDEIWRLEGAAINTLERQGVTQDSVNVGDRLRAVGYASRRGRPEMFTGMVYFEDGRELVLADGIAIDLGLRSERVSTGNIVTSGAAADSSGGGRGIFRVWSRRDAGYPEGPESGFEFTAEALAAQQAWNPLTDDTGLRCVPQGMPGVMVNPYPVEFVDQGDEIILRVEEWDTVRTIHMNSDRDADISPSSLGYSVGRWEGATLVVDTTEIDWPYFDDVGTPQSQALRVEERFSLNDEGTRLDYVLTASDPSIFAEPAVLAGYFWLEEGATVKPFGCTLLED